MNKNTYRGKRKDNGEWVYGDLIRSPHGQYRISACMEEEGFYIDAEKVSVYEIDEVTLGRSVGLSDCFTEPLYTGDLVECFGEICEIWYCLDKARFEIVGEHLRIGFDKVTQRDVRKVGNIYGEFWG